MAAERYIVHRVFEGKDEVIGCFTVEDGKVVYPNKVAEANCDIIPPGPMHEATKRRLVYLLDNKDKSVYLVKG